MASDGKALTGLWFDDQRYFASTLSPDNGPSTLPIFEETAAWLDTYFSGKDPGMIPNIAPRGTDYRLKVWSILCGIPFGKTITYGSIAEQLGSSKRSAQAVGGAVGHNPISIIIPCHRVIGSGGDLTGYAGGVDRKRELLRLEGN